MTKRITSLFLVLALCLTFFPVMASAAEETANVWDGSVAEGFAGGTGTEEDPYQIATGSQLAYLASQVNSGTDYKGIYFILTANINLNNVAWTPIGNSLENAFSGNLDGRGYTISNLVIETQNIPQSINVYGLFGAEAGKISNVYVDTVSVNVTVPLVSGAVRGMVGGFAGYALGEIENCHLANLSMTCDRANEWTSIYWIGGFIGVLDADSSVESSIYGCSVSGTIEEKSGKGSIGGFIGELAENAKISYSKADVALNVEANGGGADVGGFIGKGNGNRNEKTVISNCYATGNVTGGSYIGGFAGSLWGLNIKNCYATGDVTQAAASMASFVGTDASAGYAYGSIKNCYATGKVEGTAPYVYAFAMQDKTERSPMTNCYYNEANKQSNDESTTAMPLDEMKKENFANALNKGDTTNNWIYKAGQTPLCGAEPADYRKVTEALEKIPDDLTSYTTETVEALENAKANVVRGKVIAKQSEVDAMVKPIEDAVAALQYKPADYTAVDAAIAKANTLNKDDYKDFAAVETAVNAVVRGKNISEQSQVDAMAKAINDAIEGLEKKSTSSGGHSSGSSGNTTTKTETTTNPDGSTTKTETKKDGSVTETTTGTDGSVTKTETKTDTKADGSKTETVTETKTDADGNKTTSKTETTTDKSGNVTETVKETLPNGTTGTTTTITDASGAKTEAEVTVSSKAVDEAKKNDTAVTVPVDVKATEDSQTAPTVKVGLPSNSGETKVEIPVSNVTPGTVVAVIKPDGTEEIVKDCIPTENGLQVTVADDVTLKIFDNAKNFTDTKGHWAEPYIDFASARELLNGISEDTFAPEQPTTRAMMWTVLARQDDADLSGGTTWYDKAQAWVKDSGVSDGTNPQANVTRAQMVTMLWRAAGSPAPKSTNSFADVPADVYYTGAVAWAAEHGITNGVSATQFQPNGACTRAQIAAFLYRASLGN